MRVRSSQRMRLAHWFTSIGRSRQLLIHLAKKWPVSNCSRMDVDLPAGFSLQLNQYRNSTFALLHRRQSFPEHSTDSLSGIGDFLSVTLGLTGGEQVTH